MKKSIILKKIHIGTASKIILYGSYVFYFFVCLLFILCVELDLNSEVISTMMERLEASRASNVFSGRPYWLIAFIIAFVQALTTYVKILILMVFFNVVSKFAGGMSVEIEEASENG